jgi:hypothetical protein
VLDRGLDQAAGLRRLMASAQPQLNLMAFPTTEGAGDQWIVRLARGLTALGSRPIVLDAGRGRLTQAFGLKPRHDLLDLLQGALEFGEVAQEAAGGVWVMRAERGVEAFVASGAPPEQLFTGFARLSHRFDSILLAMPAHEIACLANPAQAMPVIPLEAGEQGMTRAYALLKELAMGFGYGRFALVLQGSHDEAAHQRLAGVAREFLDAEVVLAGRLPALGATQAADGELARNLLDTAALPLQLH